MLNSICFGSVLRDLVLQPYFSSATSAPVKRVFFAKLNFIPGSKLFHSRLKLTFSTNLFHHSLLAPTWTTFSDYTGPNKPRSRTVEGKTVPYSGSMERQAPLTNIIEVCTAGNRTVTRPVDADLSSERPQSSSNGHADTQHMILGRHAQK